MPVAQMDGDDALIGQVVGGRYRVTGLLGEGGMGFIFKAIQHPVNRPVALKVLKDNYMGDQVIRDRFLREAEAIARLSHRNIVTLFDDYLDMYRECCAVGRWEDGELKLTHETRRAKA